MKVLYAIQATGNGHVSRANEIIPLLQKKCDLDILLSGTQADVGLNHPVKYSRKGLSFIFGKKGGVDLYKTFKQMQSKKFLSEIKKLPVEEYDLVINDFEPISAWACKIKNIPCIGMSHQFGVMHRNAPRPVNADLFAIMVLKYYAPCQSGVGFHFKKYGDNIFTPVIKKEIRNALVKNLGHYTVYLPAYDDKKLVSFFSVFKNTEWQIFSKHSNKIYKTDNCCIQPVSAAAFTESFTTCEGIICGAGFETPAEALQMGKKLLVIPMKHQYEQHCNAAAAHDLGVPVIKSLKKKHLHKVENWLNDKQALHINFPDETEKIIDLVLAGAAAKKINKTLPGVLSVTDSIAARWL
jgi:uncharacterized protein (TIGR00661 family)